VLAVASVGFTACDSSANQSSSQSSSESHEGHGEAATKGTVAVEVPDYSSAGAPMKAPLAEMYGQYLQMKDALVAGKADEAKAAAGGLTAALGKIDAAILSGEQKTFFDEHAGMIRQHAGAIAGTADLSAQRGQLNMLSTSAYSLLKAFGANDQMLYYQYCPMANDEKGGNWISQTSEIKNPYFGEKMLKCGETQETLAAR